jgi:hypothetical protein
MDLTEFSGEVGVAVSTTSDSQAFRDRQSELEAFQRFKTRQFFVFRLEVSVVVVVGKQQRPSICTARFVP